jgi:uncharacterized lipoprotein YmbA
MATRSVSAALLLVLAGCGSSPPTRFYTLSPVPGSAPAAVSDRRPLKISAVHVPGVLDRNNIIRGEANYQLDISAQDRWGADLGEMIRQTLTEDLQERLPGGMVIAPRSPAPENTRGVVIDVLSFGPDTSGQVTLDATWTLQGGSPAQVVLQRPVHLSAPAAQRPATSAAAQAAAMSALLGHLADDIASALSQASAARR